MFSLGKLALIHFVLLAAFLFACALLTPSFHSLSPMMQTFIHVNMVVVIAEGAIALCTFIWNS